MALTAAQQTEMDKVKAHVKNMKETVQNSLNLQANGGYHMFNLALDLEKMIEKVEAAE